MWKPTYNISTESLLSLTSQSCSVLCLARKSREVHFLRSLKAKRSNKLGPFAKQGLVDIFSEHIEYQINDTSVYVQFLNTKSSSLFVGLKQQKNVDVKVNNVTISPNLIKYIFYKL